MLRNLFTPMPIGRMEIKNRFVVPAMVTLYCNTDGTATERFVSYYEAKAKGGWGLIIVEDCAVDPDAGAFTRVPGMWCDAQIEGHQELPWKVHQYGAKIVAQIYHAGRQIAPIINGKKPVAPSPLADPLFGQIPHELSATEIRKLVEQFGDAAVRAMKCGFDGVELHGGHGYLLDQFMSPFSNKRSDAYGGNLINRFRFSREVISNIRAKTGDDFPILYRLSADELVHGGLTIEDSKTNAMLLEEAGVDAINVSVGVSKSFAYIMAPSSMRHAWTVDYAQEIRSVVGIPIIAVGRINDPYIAESVLVSEKADFVAMGRASIADPDLPNKAKEGRYEDIIHCIGCLQACIGNVKENRPLACLVNPMTGRETECKMQTAKKKKIYIAGGGIGGSEAAIVAAQRGHEVHLFEKNDRLGGQWLQAAIPPGKQEFNTFTVWQRTQLEKLGVKIRLRTELTRQMIENDRPDSVIIACGAVPFVPEIPGKDKDHVVNAVDVLAGKVATGQSVVVIGGGMVGAETALHLAIHNKAVKIVEMLPEIATDGAPAMTFFLLKELRENNVEILTRASLKQILDKGVVVEIDGNEKTIINIDTVVMALGSKSVDKLRDEMKDNPIPVVTIGDARAVRKGVEAVEEGFRAGMTI